jgi:predicted RNA-binding Zn ribbon-like protein
VSWRLDPSRRIDRLATPQHLLDWFGAVTALSLADRDLLARRFLALPMPAEKALRSVKELRDATIRTIDGHLDGKSAGTTEAGTTDARTGDARTGDARTGDARTGDARTGDAGTGDAGTGGAGTRDAGTADAGTRDARTGDAGTGDAGTGGAGTRDAGTADAGTRDAGTADAGTRDAGTRDAGERDIDLIATAWRRALAVATTPAHLPWQWRVEPSDPETLVHALALSVAELLHRPDQSRLRRCDGDGCGWLFLDTTRNHSRRWCDPLDCGNRARVRSYVARHRSRVQKP